VRAPADAERQRFPRAARDASPRERAERHATVAEQAQRAQQVLEDLAPAGDRLTGVVLAGGERDDQVPLVSVARLEQRSLGQPLEDVGLGDRQAARQRQLARADRQPMQRGDERRLPGARERRALDTRERRTQALGAQLEVGLFGELSAPCINSRCRRRSQSFSRRLRAI
jgi:hypothetical protein